MRTVTSKYYCNQSWGDGAPGSAWFGRSPSGAGAGAGVL